MRTGPMLEVNLSAIVRNYKLLRGKLLNNPSPSTGEGKGGGEETATIPPSLILPRKGGGNKKQASCAAVVKADAYGLGASHVAPALMDAGCRHFFVATLEEGIALRGTISASAPGVNIYVFHGPRKNEAKEMKAHRLIPVINSLEQLAAWGDGGPCVLHIDTGMNRLGLTVEEARSLEPAACKPQFVMSHLACANDAQNPMNARQLADFNSVLPHFAGVPASLANSSGIFLGNEYHFDLVRPGCALYGITSNSSRPNPMENVVTLSATVLQYRHIKKPQSVGYGASYQAREGSVIATVELGYADGFLRHLSNKGHAIAAGMQVPLVGRVSMDMVMLDVSAVPEHLRTPELRVTFIGKEQPVDCVAREAGTIGYEIFTRLGPRVKRVYKQ